MQNTTSASCGNVLARNVNIATGGRRAITTIFIILFLLSCLNSFSQGLGIDAVTPNTKLDVNGDMSLRIGSYTAVNGNNNDINIGAFSFVRITGPTVLYIITGIAGGVDGKVVILYNATGFDMNIANQNASSTLANRIICSNNTNALVKQNGCAMLIYSVTDSRWILVSLYSN